MESGVCGGPVMSAFCFLGAVRVQIALGLQGCGSILRCGWSLAGARLGELCELCLLCVFGENCGS